LIVFVGNEWTASSLTYAYPNSTRLNRESSGVGGHVPGNKPLLGSEQEESRWPKVPRPPAKEKTRRGQRVELSTPPQAESASAGHAGISHTGPIGPDPGEREQWPAFISSEPDRYLLAVDRVLSENDVNGTRQRFSGPSQRCQCLLPSASMPNCRPTGARGENRRKLSAAERPEGEKGCCPRRRQGG
jgi:hypothetical protein